MAKTLFLVFVLMTGVVVGAEEKLGDVPDGSRSNFVHLIPMLAEPLPGKEPDQIHPGDEPVLPFSTKATCGACHSYDIITTGWHFNAIDPNVKSGRRGQPWILADPPSATQIPLSYRPWPGVFRPQEIGLTPMGFLQYFGRQLPGGGIGEMVDTSDNPEEILRAGITGKLEINCLACHNISPGVDMGGASGYAIQIIRGNYRWAATASSEFAYVTGTTEDLKDYDFRAPFLSSDTKLRPPAVEYYKDSFKHNDWARFDVSVEIPKQRCYFCHSNADVRDGKNEKWLADEDVHLTAGLKCMDCHRNGLPHDIIRGYPAEPCDSNNSLAAVSSCQGCHTAKNNGPPLNGRFTAPVPKHIGLPKVHFDKLTCTACHSGPWPKETTVRTQTARAHALGVARAKKGGDVLPHLTYPVFAKGQDGKIGVFKLLWPAYWASEANDNVTPLNLDTVKGATSKVIAKSALSKERDWPNLTEEDIAKILTLLVSKVPAGSRPVYIASGKLFSLNDAGKITSAENPAASPYMWPIAHDIRPSAQSLGVRNCKDCHSTDSPFFFGNVSIDTPIKPAKEARGMASFEGLNKTYEWCFAFSFIFRPWLKAVTILSSLVIAGVLLLYALKALGFIAKAVIGDDS